ncbi:MAG: choice-of-anchor B family protein [Cryomorphaceae bacterium]|nr:choice-of-anchor B family protein [Cryomorphaceae bacterium]
MKNLIVGTFALLSINALAQIPCTGGSADGYPCSNIDLYAVLPFEELGGEDNGNDIWGWVEESSQREFAIYGMANGTAFIEITDPLNPVYIGMLPTHNDNSLWRDIKVYQNHAFIVSEASFHGLQVFDLSQLPVADNLPVIFEETAHYNSFGHCHNIAINEETGYAYAVGTSTFNGGLHIVNIQNPANPVIAGEYGEDGYTHDAQVVIYNGPDADYQGKEIAFAFNEDNVAIVDVSDKTECTLIAHAVYDNPQYTHQGWLSDDQRYLFMDDELDEQNLGTQTKTYIFDVSDLDNPLLLGFFLSNQFAIDHNMYVKGSLLFQSNYLAGLRILSIEDVENGNLEEVAFFDTNPGPNFALFDGSWSNYPYFPSGNVVVSTFSHFFIVRPTDEILALNTQEVSAQPRDVKVFPNPSNDVFYIALSNVTNMNAVEVYDLGGRLVKSFSLPKGAGGKLTLIVSDLESGYYSVVFPEFPEMTSRIIKN